MSDIAPVKMGVSPNGDGVTDERSAARALERDPVEQAVVGQCGRCQAEAGRVPRHVEHEAMSAAHRQAIGVDLDQPRRRVAERSEERPYITQTSYPPE